MNNYETMLAKFPPESGITALSDIAAYSFAEFSDIANETTLSWRSIDALYQAAKEEIKENLLAEAKSLAHANPQLRNAVRLGIVEDGEQANYSGFADFPERADNYALPGSVMSKFSPAGYLTELYREAKSLHATASIYHLDIRRPDLAGLTLTQSNLDNEISTLALSNEVLMAGIKKQANKNSE